MSQLLRKQMTHWELYLNHDELDGAEIQLSTGPPKIFQVGIQGAHWSQF